MKRRVLVADCFPPDLLPEMERNGLLRMGQAEVVMVNEFDAAIDCDVCYPADPSQNLPDSSEIARYDGMLWSGTTFSTTEDVLEIQRQITLMQSAFAAGVPIFGICGGLQVAAVAAGGRVVENPKGLESGIARQIRLTSTGATHPMFQFRQSGFDAVCDHYDVVVELPGESTVLATNAMAEVQAAIFHVGESEFWGVQYHPDMDLSHLRALPSFRRKDWVKHGLVRDDADMDLFQDMASRLESNPNDKAAAWLLGVGQDILDPILRRAEVHAWLLEHIQ